MSTSSPSSEPIGGRRLALISGVLLPPAIFLLALTLRYSLAVAACRAHAVRIPLEAAAILSLVVLTFILLRSWRQWRGSAAPMDEDDTASDDRFLAGLGILTASLALVATLALWLPSAFLGPCGAGTSDATALIASLGLSVPLSPDARHGTCIDRRRAVGA